MGPDGKTTVCAPQQQLEDVRALVLEEQVVETVLEKARVTDKNVPYEDAVKPEAPAAPAASEGDAEEA